MVNSYQVCLLIVFVPLLGALLAGFGRKQLGKRGAHCVTITGVAISFACSLYVALSVFTQSAPYLNTNLYTWVDGGALFNYSFAVGFLLDPLTAVMLLIVTFVSLLVHIYSIGYMADDDGYARFFAYISLFTFMMLMLVTSNNFLQLFFGWEGVGLVSYLLIGFWYQKESALSGSLKAFLVNRVGDFGFILGIGLLLATAGSLDYAAVFHHVPSLLKDTIILWPGVACPTITVICILLYIGAMGKSAQVPLHVWLPESMEGPTPISALIHAATMVTAGVFMLARISPLLEYSEAAQSMVLIIGATGALLTGILAIVMNDIKRVIAYSTLSQLGYMMAAMGVSAFSAGIFHLVTHACFKALLFLAAGSVIVGMHHEQDMRRMGGLWRKMPITYVTFLIGSLALCAIPPFSGFYSKETIIEAVHSATIAGSGYAYGCVTLGALMTAIYTFRAFFMTFHGQTRLDQHGYSHVKESPWVIWLPLVILAIPSVVIGYILYMPMLFNQPSLVQASLVVLPHYDVLGHLAREITSPLDPLLHAYTSPAFWLTLLGVCLAWVGYWLNPRIPAILARVFRPVYQLLVYQYGVDAFNNWFFVRGSLKLGQLFYRVIDQHVIDGFFVNGFARLLNFGATTTRLLQSGYLYHYVGFMVIGLFGFLIWFVFS